MVGRIVESKESFAVREGVLENGDGNSGSMFYHLIARPVVILPIFQVL
jgi:hypothetical protein